MSESTVIHRLALLWLCLTAAACGATSGGVVDDRSSSTTATEQAPPAGHEVSRNPMMEAADRALVEGRFRDARPAYRAILTDTELNQERTRAGLLYASTLVAAGLFDEAGDDLVALLDTQTLTIEERSLALGLLGRAQQCDIVLQQQGLAADVASDSNIALIAGICAIESGQTSLAHAYLNLADRNAPAQTARAILAWVLGDTDTASTLLEEALLQEPDSLDALRNYGMLMWQMNERNVARVHLQRYLDLAPPALTDRTRVQAMLSDD